MDSFQSNEYVHVYLTGPRHFYGSGASTVQYSCMRVLDGMVHSTIHQCTDRPSGWNSNLERTTKNIMALPVSMTTFFDVYNYVLKHKSIFKSQRSCRIELKDYQ